MTRILGLVLCVALPALSWAGGPPTVEMAAGTFTMGGEKFEAEIREVRASGLRAILEDQVGFQYCDPGSMEPMDDEKMRDEVRGILKKVQLTDSERAALEGRIPKLKGVRFSGG